jgi:heme a synthase
MPYLLNRWLNFVAFLVFCLVIVGGATRLTGSGLSITEWRPLTGVLPPLNEMAWFEEFAKYKTIPQYEILNKGMGLAAFKIIYFWEWGHRLLARFTGLALLLPFLFFWLRGHLSRAEALKIFGIGCLIATQGFVGWIMVASGLSNNMIAVAPVKLMLHLTLAAVIFTLLLVRAKKIYRLNFTFSFWQKVFIIALLLQIALGALVAGNNAGMAYNTWPLMDGGFSPPREVLFMRPVWLENFIDSLALVQLNHRLYAYALVVFASWLMWKKAFNRTVYLLLMCQAVIGIATLLLPQWHFTFGLLHQAFAFIVLAAAAVKA